MPKYEEYRAGKIISQTGRGITMVEEMLDDEDGDPVRPPTESELHHQALYSGLEQLTGRDATHITEPAQQGDGWKLGLVLTVIAVIVIVGLILG